LFSTISMLKLNYASILKVYFSWIDRFGLSYSHLVLGVKFEVRLTMHDYVEVSNNGSKKLSSLYKLRG
jgi:hypothetical protein